MGTGSKLLVAALFCSSLAASTARAQIASQPHDGSAAVIHRGIYLGLGANVGAQFSSGFDAKLTLGGEARLGYSFNRALQLYLAGDFNLASGYTQNPNAYPMTTQSLTLITAHLHHFLFQERSGLGVYYDVGIGLGLVNPGYGPTGAMAVGLGYAGGLGVEIPITPTVSIAPEFFYRAVNSASSDNGVTGNISAIGLQIAALYY